MKLLEYQAKEVLASFGIAIPPGKVATTPEEAAVACREIGPEAVKAQVPVGGRDNRANVLLLSARGGMDIETVAEDSPEAISKLYPSPWRGPLDFELRRLV